MSFFTSTHSRSQPLTRNASARRNRFLFFVGRKKVAPTRAVSVRRNHSRHRRAPSSATTTHKRQPVGKVGSNQPLRAQILDEPEPEKANPAELTSMEHTGAVGQSSKRPMASSSTPRKDADLPPIPAESAPQQEGHKHGAGMLKRLTTKLRRPSTSQPSHAAFSSHPPPPVPPLPEAGPSQSKPKRKNTLKLPSLPSLPKGPTPTLPNSFTSPEQRQAALRAMGLIPAVPHPYKDSHGYMLPLSEQEKVLDKRYTVVLDSSDEEEEGESEAKKIREAWLKKNHEQQVESSSQPQEHETQSQAATSSRPQHQQSESTSSTTSSSRASTSADAYRSETLTLSATERASAPALTEDGMVIKRSPQSLPLGTFAETNPHPPPSAPLSPTLADCHQELAVPCDKDRELITVEPEARVDPWNIPLPPSPGISRKEQEESAQGEEREEVLDDDTERPSSSDVSEKVARWLQSTPTGSLSKGSPSEPSSPRSGADSPIDKALPAIKTLSSPSPSSSPLSPSSNSFTSSSSPTSASSASPISVFPTTSASPINIRGRKDKPSPISITATAIAVKTSTSTSTSPSASASPPAVASANVIALQSPPPPFDDPRSPRTAALPKLSISPPTPLPPPISSSAERGRSLTVSNEHRHADLDASSGSDSRSRSKVPALSPTRTTSSSGASEVPPTPTTTSQRGRKASIVSSTSQSSDNHNHNHHVHLHLGSHLHASASRNLNSKPKVSATRLEESEGINVASVIVESPVEDRDDDVDLKCDDDKILSASASAPMPMPTPRPRPARPSEDSQERGERRKSLTFVGLFGSSKSGLGLTGPSSPPEKPSKLPSPSRSMSNLRRSVAGTISSKFRPKTLVVDTSPRGHSPSRSSPLSPFGGTGTSTSPPSAYRGIQTFDAAGVPLARARPRPPKQPLSPTMHSRGSILMETKGIEDDESRRLSELAFLDF